jgi:hypothetical protein
MRYRQGLAELALFPSNPSYEVTRTSNLPSRDREWKVFRNNFLAFLARFNRFNAAPLLNSRIQFLTTDFGTITMWGP